MTSTHLKELALGFVKHIVYAINSDKAATDSGSLTEHVVRNGQGEIVWRAYKNGTAAHRVAKSRPDYTVDSRKLTVTIELGKWESEKETPKTQGRKFQKGDRVRIQSNAANNKWTGKLGTIVDGNGGSLYDWNVLVDGYVNAAAFYANELTLELAAWEAELLNRLERYAAAIENGLSDAEARGEFSEEADAATAEPEPKFTKGDRVAYTSWVGKRIEGVVIGESSVSNPSWEVLSDSGITHMIAESELSKIEPAKPAPKFKVGDTIYSDFGDSGGDPLVTHKGVVTRVHVFSDNSVGYDVETDTWRNLWPEREVRATKFKVGQEVKTFYQGYTVRGTIKRLPVEGTLYAAPSPYYIVSVSYKFSFETVHRTEDEIYE